MTNMSIQPLWLTHFIEILLVLEFQLTQFIVGAFSYKAHFRPRISPNGILYMVCIKNKYSNNINNERNKEKLHPLLFILKK